MKWTLQTIRNYKPKWQMILSFSNDNDVVITTEDFDPNSVFTRRSKIRLSVDFDLIEDNVKYKVFKSNRKHGCEYTVLLASEYMVLELRKRHAYKTKKSLEEVKQMSIKDILPPNPNRIAEVKLFTKGHFAQWTLHHQELSKDCTYKYNVDKSVPEWYVLFGLVVKLCKVLSDEDQIKHFSVLRIYINDKQKGLFKFLNGAWTPRNDWSKMYTSEMLNLKKVYASHGVTLTFSVI